MILISVRALGPAEVALGAREVRLEVREEASVGELLDKADAFADGRLRDILYVNGERNEWVRVLLNGWDVRFLPEENLRLKADDVVHIMPTLGGG